MDAVRQKTTYDQAQWQESPWTTQEKPAWFSFASPSLKKRERKNVLSFIFTSAPSRTRSQLRPSSQIKAERLRNNPSKTGYSSPRQASPFKWVAYYKHHWIDKEFLFAMNKLSIVSMVVGLMFLGALFFISGFLLAVNLYSAPSFTTPNLKVISESSTHRASPNAFVSAHRPTQAPSPVTVPQQYAKVGGVAIVPPGHRPSQSLVEPPAYSQPQPVYNSYGAPSPYPPQATSTTPYPSPQYSAPAYSQSMGTQAQSLPAGVNNHAQHPNYAPSYPQVSGPSTMIVSPHQ